MKQKYSHLSGTLLEAVEERVRIGDENMSELYDIIFDNQGLSIYALSRKIGWSPGKTSYTINKLKDLGAVKETSKITNGRNCRLIYIKEWHESFSIEDIIKLKEFVEKEEHLYS